MKRYSFLDKKSVYETFNRLRDAFLSAKNGYEVEYIIDGILTTDEKFKIGRRILIAECLMNKMTVEQIEKQLKVGRNTVIVVAKTLQKNPQCFELINKRHTAVAKKYHEGKYREVGGSKLIRKKKIRTDLHIKDIQR